MEEELPDNVIISNIDAFRNIIKQQKKYVDEMQLHLSNKDNIIIGLEKTIISLESTIQKLKSSIEQPINKKQYIYDISNELSILKQLEEKEKIINDMLINYISKEQYTKEKEQCKILIKNKIKKKYIKKKLEIYKNENMLLKNQIEFFKNMLMMNKFYDINYNQSTSLHNQPSSLHNQPSPLHNQPTPLHNQPTSSLHNHASSSYRTNVKSTEQIIGNNNNEIQHKNKMGCVLEQLQQLQKQKNQK